MFLHQGILCHIIPLWSCTTEISWDFCSSETTELQSLNLGTKLENISNVEEQSDQQDLSKMNDNLSVERALDTEFGTSDMHTQCLKTVLKSLNNSSYTISMDRDESVASLRTFASTTSGCLPPSRGFLKAAPHASSNQKHNKLAGTSVILKVRTTL